MHSSQKTYLLVSLGIVAMCGICYELLLAAIATYLLGNSIYYFSLVIGLFMFAMGLGSFISKRIEGNLTAKFIFIEIALGVIGGLSGIVLFFIFPLARDFFEIFLFSFVIIIGALVGMEIPILTGILAKEKSAQKVVADIMSFDYVGALIGSVGFPLILLPTMGILTSSFAIGLGNIFAACWTCMVFWNAVESRKYLLETIILSLVLLIGFLVSSSYLTSMAEKNLYFDKIVYSQQSPYQNIVLTRSNNGKDHRLYLDGHIQFSTKDEYRYHEYLVHPAITQVKTPENVLILGGGDGLAAREVLKHKEVQRIDLVDIDPLITEFGQSNAIIRRLNESSLINPKLNVYNDDAFSFLNSEGVLYDVIIIDLPDPHNEALNKLYTKEFYRIAEKRMSNDGVLVTQSSSPFFTRRVFWSINATLGTVFEQVTPYNITLPSFGIWGFNLAFKNSTHSKNSKPIDNTRVYSYASFEKAKIFEDDIAKIDASVNSIFSPTIYMLYLDDLKS